jgi:Flp pilus assembly protein TadG
MRERGAAVVEAAIVLPLLLLIAVGVGDLGRAYFTLALVQEAAQEGVFYAAIHPDDPAGAQQAVIEAVSSPTLTLSDVTVTCPAVDQIAVTVSYSMSMITPIMSQFAGGSLNLSDTEVARVLKSGPCVPSP